MNQTTVSLVEGATSFFGRAITELVNVIFGGIAEAIPIILAGVLLYERRQALRAKRLRHALIAEIEASQPELTPLMPYGNAYLEGSVYRSNAGKLDLLTNDEIDSVIRFYHSLTALHEVVENEGPEVDPGDIPDHIYSNAESRREEALSKLRNHVDNSTVTVRKPRSE